MAIKVSLEMARLQHLIGHTGTADVVRYVADGVEYGIHQEMGTVRQGYAQPFMLPAVEAVRASWLKAFQNQLTNDQVEGVVVKTAFDVAGIAARRAPRDTSALANSIHVTEGKP